MAFFVECVADTHNGAAFDLALQLSRIHNDARFHGDGTFFNDDGAGARSDGGWAKARFT